MIPLVRHLLRRQGPFLAVNAFLLGLFQFLICTAVSATEIGAALETLFQSLPPLVHAAIATQFPAGLSESGLLAFGWNHPIAHALGLAVSIVLAARAVAGEIETGSLELLLSQPMSRAGYLGTHVLFGLLALGLLSLAGVAGTRLGQAVFHMEAFPPGRLLALTLNYFLLQAAWFGVTLAFSAFGREGDRVTRLGFLVAVGSYFAQAIGQLWSDAGIFLPWTLHYYFSPQGILIRGTSVVRPVVTLLAVTSASLGVAAWRFRGRDLP
jgi:beta-exotoxin I transport system permease protein